MTRDTKADVPNWDNMIKPPGVTTKEGANLADRVALAKQVGAKALVSIHADAAGSNASGFTAYYYANKNSGVNLDSRQQQSKQLAKAIADALADTEMPPFNGEVIRGANYQVLREAPMPATLIETGYMTNKDDARKLNTKKFQKGAGEAIADAIDKSISSNKNGSLDRGENKGEQESGGSGLSMKYSAI